MLAVTATDTVHFEFPIFRDSFEWYDANNVDFLFFTRNWLSRVDFRLYVTLKKIVQRWNIAGQITVPKRAADFTESFSQKSHVLCGKYSAVLLKPNVSSSLRASI